ncbi:MAG TPA: hypothetical protein VNT26_24260 [Candidatus Sulfotelmatobacter sp.]|nr:hypothetical protein [Candidatus Sulfotelmatobacter sp.]HWI56627.1 hypothetical protein [Bacillota bacterium]
MLQSFEASAGSRFARRPRLSSIRNQIATRLVGRTVNLMADQIIARGVVAGVLHEAGVAKLVVDGRRYDLNQLLTVHPTSLP